jgi:S-methylmethionine-dependent homocysteine/selenocysteine methylase
VLPHPTPVNDDYTSSPTTLPSVGQWIELHRKVREAERPRGVHVVLAHWGKIATFIASLAAAWQWNEARIKTRIEADQALAIQARAVLLNSAARDASVEADRVNADAVAGNARAIAKNTESIGTLVEIQLAQPSVRRAVKRDQKLAAKTKRILGLNPLEEL